MNLIEILIPVRSILSTTRLAFDRINNNSACRLFGFLERRCSSLCCLSRRVWQQHTLSP